MAYVAMTYAKWAALIMASFVVDIIGLFIVPFAIALSDGHRLPGWARAWDNDREPLGDVDRKAAIDATSGIWRGFLRWRWLCLRNPGNNFGYLLGFDQLRDTPYWYAGDPRTSDQGRPGWLYVDTDGAFCFYAVWRWSAARCLRVFLGWKIHDMVRDGTRAQIVCVINPFMTFTEA